MQHSHGDLMGPENSYTLDPNINRQTLMIDSSISETEIQGATV